MQLLRVFFSSCSKMDLQGYLSSSTLGCSWVEGVHSVMLYVVHCWKMCSLEKKNPSKFTKRIKYMKGCLKAIQQLKPPGALSIHVHS